MGDITLAQQYQQTPSLLTKGVVRALQDESELLDTLNFKDIKATTVRTWRSGELREVKWRRINQPFGTVIQGQPKPIEAGMFSFGNTVDVDYLLKEDQTAKIVDPEADQIQQTVTAMARQFNDYWVNNDPINDPAGIVGLKYIIDNEFPEQMIVADPSGADVLDLDPTGADYATNIGIFFRSLEKAIAAVHGEKPNFAVCNKTFLLNFRAICRDSGYLKTTEDSLGRQFIEFNGVKFIDAGYKVDDTTMIIGDNENYNGVVTDDGMATSIYLVRMDEQHYQPFEFEALTTDRVGLLEDRTNYRTVIKWDVGHIITHPRSVSRLTGLKF